MITERPLLTIRREFPRPEAKSAGRFAGAATVHLVDAIGGRGALGDQIKAVSRTAATFAGPALTCYAGADNTLAILAALELAQPGDVVVAATEEFTGSALVGDLFARHGPNSRSRSDSHRRPCPRLAGNRRQRPAGLCQRRFPELRRPLRTRHGRPAGRHHRRAHLPR